MVVKTDSEVSAEEILWSCNFKTCHLFGKHLPFDANFTAEAEKKKQGRLINCRCNGKATCVYAAFMLSLELQYRMM